MPRQSPFGAKVHATRRRATSLAALTLGPRGELRESPALRRSLALASADARA
jgi:hypothetical protein